MVVCISCLTPRQLYNYNFCWLQHLQHPHLLCLIKQTSTHCNLRHPCARRYADVIVHRLLGAALALSVLPDSIQDRPRLRDLSDNLNTRHRNAQFAGRASVELYTLLFFLNKPTLADGRITKVSPVSAPARKPAG